MNTTQTIAKKGILVNNTAAMEGFLLIDKPDGMTSHDVVDRVRKLTGERRVGHAGTLDPFATGLLIIGVGRPATREMQKLVGLDKRYKATFLLGAESDTDDKTGVITENPIQSNLSEASLQEALQTFTGTIEQIPPAYSAIKVKGKKLYEAAREGKPIEVKARQVEIHEITLTNVQTLEEKPIVNVEIHCGSGTYIRAIARDLGRKLGGGGYVEVLERTHIGPYTIDAAAPLDSLTPEGVQACLQPVETFLSQL